MNSSNILKCSLSILLLSLAVAVIAAVKYGPAWAQEQIKRESEATRKSALTAIADTRRDLLKEVADTRRDLLSEVDQIRGDANRQIGGLVTATHGPEGSLKSDLLARVDTLSGNVNTQLTTLQAGLKPSLDNVASITGHANEASAILFRRDALPAQILGTIGAAKVTLGQTAQTMRTFREATPGLLATVQKIGNNSDVTTAKLAASAEESRRLMHNLAVNTTPLPKFIRYPAQIIGLVGSAAVPVITLQKLSTVGTAASAIAVK